jgi:PPK2 family polyphosphate:nucleotide phosphotransferase
MSDTKPRVEISKEAVDVHRVNPGSGVKIGSLPTGGREFHPDRKSAEVEFKALRHELIEAQRKLYAEGRQSLLIVFQAMDAGGKDGCIRHCFKGVNPQGVRVASFKAPNSTELSHDYLWRIHQQLPPRGMFGVFNRSHYEDVLVVRVDKLAPKEVWKRRYDQLNHFEQMVTDEGLTILKFFLNISPKEQKKRFQERLDDRSKHYKFESADLAKRKQWDDYMEAYEDVLNKCSTDWAPWFAIPSDQKWYRNLAVMRVMVAKLREMNPQFPDSDPALKDAQLE